MPRGYTPLRYTGATESRFRTGLVRHHRSPSDQAWRIHIGEGPQRKDPSIHHWVEQAQTPLCVDEDT